MYYKKSNIDIVNLFRKNIFLEKTIREISFLLDKDYPNTYNSVMELSKNNLLNIKEVGKSKLISFKLSPESLSLLSFLDINESLSKKIPNIDKILGIKEISNDIILVTGSYSKGTQTLKSDIDLVIITKDDVFKKQKLIENLTSLFHPKFHIIVISNKDFIDMLHEKKPNFGKEIFNSRLIFKNVELYYNLIKEAIGNGFRG
ncbi:MAG TPA: nucleotidyltransferase domain-containing protein [Candidatus Nanoarchaeia archaeon]|nr:nucleotidyltransferase domain-containing protein [Candidatus Nanoarchaeia archaeon]